MVLLVFELIGIKMLWFFLSVREFTKNTRGLVYLVIIACEARLGLSLMVGIVRYKYLSYVMYFKLYNI